MTVNQMIAKLQAEAANGNGELQVVCDYPLGLKGYEPGEWSTIMRVEKMTAGGNYLKMASSGGLQDVIYLDWRCG